MIALPFHPSNAWTIHEFLENAAEILARVEQDAQQRYPKAHVKLTDKDPRRRRLGGPGCHRRMRRRPL